MIWFPPSLQLNPLLVVALVTYLVFLLLRVVSRRLRTIPLKGPPSPGFLFGAQSVLNTKFGDTGDLFEGWAREYGSVYRVAMPLGGNRIVLFDAKAISFLTAHDTTTFLRPSITRHLIARLVGNGVLCAEEDDHKRQRRVLAPAFNNSAVRNVASVFFDSAHKAKLALESMLQTSTRDAIEVNITTWLDCVTFDSIGIAGFGHDFGTLRGERSETMELFEALSHAKRTRFENAMLLLGFVFPVLLKLPSQDIELNAKINQNFEAIAEDVLMRTRREKNQEGTLSQEDKSIIGLLLKAEGSRLSKQEVIDQMKLLILAGFDTTAITMTWAFIELCRHPEVQARLRQELAELSGRDPTYEELVHGGLPYLDAVVHETLRVHGAVNEIMRVSATDQAIPLSRPIKTASGKLTDHITVCEGQWVSMHIHGVNKSINFWGPDAKAFKPERWLHSDSLPGKAQELQGHRHILTFSDGPRFCIGRIFAMAEFKAVLAVLVRSFSFEFPEGPHPEFENKKAVLDRPGVKGEDGTRIQLIVKGIE